MKKGIIGIIIILLIIWIATSVQKSKEVSENPPIKIGASISLTGVAARFGEMSKMGIDLAVEEINSNGGINGRLVEVVIEDDETNPTKALGAMQKLVSIDKVDAIIGSLFDFVTQPLLTKAEELKLPLISPANFRIPGSFDMNEYTFVLYPDFEKSLRAMKYVIESDADIQNLAIVRFQSEFSTEIERVLNNIMIELKRPSVVSEVYAEIGSTDFRTPILKLREKNIDTVFLDTLDMDTVAFIKTANELGFKPKYITHTTLRDSFANSDIDTKILENIVMLDWEVPSDEFLERFQNRYGIRPIKSANKSYNAVYVLANAIANGSEKEGIKEWMEENIVTTIDGKIEFTKDHSVITSPVKLWRIEGGKFVEIYYQD